MEKLDKNVVETETLEKYGTDLTKMAKEGKLDPLIGREHEVERTIQILCKRRKNNPCLVGDPGVGKTVIAEGLAQRISNKMVPPKFSANKVFSLEMGRLIAGASHRGELEERLLKVVDEVKQSNGDIILFIDELNTLLGAGDGPLNAANILKPPLGRGEIKCIGATTIDEYRKYIEKDAALKRRFQLVEVPEPSVEETVQILGGLCHKFATHHNVHYDEKALKAAAHLSKRFISDRALPDKAIDVIDEAGSLVRNRQTEKAAHAVKALVVTEREIEEVVSSWTGIPVEKVSSEESKRLLEMEQTLNQRIIGQEEAITAVCRAIRKARVGIRDPCCPIASFLFTGPTGVGKTEVAKLVAAEFFGCKETGGMVRLDMSEYTEKHTVSRLIGSPPGYVGHEEGGQLTEAIRRRPHKLVLFDEIEKAHESVFGVMLQIMGDGRLTDGKGRTVDFRNTVIIMTSNVGGGKLKNVTGGSSHEKQVAEELKRVFKPEFLNRLDDVIVFKRLGEGEMRKILNIQPEHVCERLLSMKNIRLKVADSVKEKVAEEGWYNNSSSYGARPMRRCITRLVEDSLAEKILQGEVEEGDSVAMDLDWEGKITIVSVDDTSSYDSE